MAVVIKLGNKCKQAKGTTSDPVVAFGQLATPKVGKIDFEGGKKIASQFFETVDSKVVLADPPEAYGTLNNRENILGNIVLVARGGGIPFTQKIHHCLEAGAKAVVIGNNDQENPSAFFRIFLPENEPQLQTIPTVMISFQDYQVLKNAIAQSEQQLQFELAPLTPQDLDLIKVDNQSSTLGRTFLSAASVNDTLMVTEILQRMQAEEASKITDDDRQMTAAHICVECNYAECLEILIEANLTMERCQMDGFTPLHLAADCGNIKCADLLLNKAFVYVDFPHAIEWTALHFAAKAGHVDVARLLIDAGANPNFLTVDGCTPLHIASLHSQTEFVQLLLEHQAVPDIRCAEGSTPLDFAQQKKDFKSIAMLRAAQREARDIQKAKEEVKKGADKELKLLSKEYLGPIKVLLKSDTETLFRRSEEIKLLQKLNRTKDIEEGMFRMMEISVEKRSDFWMWMLRQKENEKSFPVIEVTWQRHLHKGKASGGDVKVPWQMPSPRPPLRSVSEPTLLPDSINNLIDEVRDVIDDITPDASTVTDLFEDVKFHSIQIVDSITEKARSLLDFEEDTESSDGATTMNGQMDISGSSDSPRRRRTDLDDKLSGPKTAASISKATACSKDADIPKEEVGPEKSCPLCSQDESIKGGGENELKQQMNELKEQIQKMDIIVQDCETAMAEPQEAPVNDIAQSNLDQDDDLPLKVSKHSGPLEWSKASCLEIMRLDIARNKFPEITNNLEKQDSLNKVLQHWLFSNEIHEHRQGLDVMASPLVWVLDDKDAALALIHLIQCYGLGYFETGGTIDVFKPKMNAISYLLLYWDPELGLHLHAQDIVPELFAVSWLTTLFASIFNLQETIYLWDTLFQFPYSFVVAFSVSILMNVREQLLNALDSSDILKVISLLNGGQITINLPRCCVQAASIFQQTPLSIWEVAEKGRSAHSIECCSDALYEDVPFLELADAFRLGQLLFVLDIRSDLPKVGVHHLNSESCPKFQVNILFYPVKCFRAQLNFIRKYHNSRVLRRNKRLCPSALRVLSGHHIGIYSNVKKHQIEVANLLWRFGFTSVFAIEEQRKGQILPWDLTTDIPTPSKSLRPPLKREKNNSVSN